MPREFQILIQIRPGQTHNLYRRAESAPAARARVQGEIAHLPDARVLGVRAWGTWAEANNSMKSDWTGRFAA